MSNLPKENQDLLIGISEGSIEAFELFYETYHIFVYSIALQLLQNELDAEDMTHDIFIEIIDKAHTYDPKKGSIKSWLAIRTKSRCIDLLRRRKEVTTEDSVVRHEAKSVDQYIPIDEKLAKKWDKQIVISALQRLPLQQRKAIFGSYYKNYSHKELSSHLEIPLGTVKSLIRYGINNLRKQLKNRKDLSLKGDEDHGL